MTEVHAKSDHLTALDATERVAIAALYVYFVYNLGSDFISSHVAFSLVLLIGESTVLIFTLIRRPAIDISRHPLEWVLGFAGTALPLLVLPAGVPLIAPAVILVVMLFGIVLQITAKLFLGRSFGIVPANRGVQASGPYGVIRHPIYAGYMLTEIGFLLANPSAWNLLLYALGWSCQIGRILLEEKLLLEDPNYRELVARVPYRLIPGLF